MNYKPVGAVLDADFDDMFVGWQVADFYEDPSLELARQADLKAQAEQRAQDQARSEAYAEQRRLEAVERAQRSVKMKKLALLRKWWYQRWHRKKK